MLQVNLFTITSSNSTCNQQLNHSGIGTKENKYDVSQYTLGLFNIMLDIHILNYQNISRFHQK